MTSHFREILSQNQYQVRFDWGYDGAVAVGSDVDVLVIVDVLSPKSSGSTSEEREATRRFVPGPGTVIITGNLRNRTAVAEWVLARQVAKAGRFTVAVIGVGESRAGEGIRFTAEDQLGAGAIVDALATVGIDYCSPEAAVACASFTTLRMGIGHLVSSSVAGKELLARGYARDVELATDVDSSSEVPVVAEYIFGL